MSNWKGGQINEWNQQIIEEFYASEGKMGERYKGKPLLLLTTIGRKSGKPRITPLAYQNDGNRLIIVASYLGASTHPDWYLNLVAQPQVSIEIGTETFVAIATTVTDRSEREQLLKHWPVIVEHQEKTTREIPFVALQIVK